MIGRIVTSMLPNTGKHQGGWWWHVPIISAWLASFGSPNDHRLIPTSYKSRNCIRLVEFFSDDLFEIRLRSTYFFKLSYYLHLRLRPRLKYNWGETIIELSENLKISMRLVPWFSTNPILVETFIRYPSCFVSQISLQGVAFCSHDEIVPWKWSCKQVNNVRKRCAVSLISKAAAAPLPCIFKSEVCNLASAQGDGSSSPLIEHCWYLVSSSRVLQSNSRTPHDPYLS
jgi:hypothetical protein